MDKRREAKIRTALIERREHIQGELDRLQEEIRALGVAQGIEHGALSNHMADDGSNVWEQERILTMSNDLQDMLNQAHGALERLDHGTYGDCERCGRPVNPERLEAFPWVRYCIECQTIVEREQNMPVRQ
ncbi:MAG TPA: TraR/DksA C4-type zinc finger protein [Thermomicrobiales bacterium]|nr:TraR/DksA C4-type zinc finger protein [Thermomicrobiales bacterium]